MYVLPICTIENSKVVKMAAITERIQPQKSSTFKGKKNGSLQGCNFTDFFLGSAKYIFLEILHDNKYITIHNKIHRSNYKCIHKVENFFMTETGIGVWWLWTLWF